MGVKITILSWSQFEGRFFSMYDVSHLGNFDPTEVDASPYPIDQGVNDQRGHEAGATALNRGYRHDP